MSVFLTVAAAVVVAVVGIASIVKVSMWLSERKAGSGPEAWSDQGNGNSDGYGRSDYGDSNGCGGGGD